MKFRAELEKYINKQAKQHTHTNIYSHNASCRSLSLSLLIITLLKSEGENCLIHNFKHGVFKKYCAVNENDF